jgi:uncharacterized protein YjbI with pentapeptide repeats
MNKRKMPGKQIKAPNIPKQELEKRLPDESLFDRAYYAQLALSHDDLTGQAADYISFDQIVFQQVRMSNTQLKKVQVLDSRLIVCDLANAEWAVAALSRVELIGCHLTGFQCSEAQLQDVLFKDCGGSFAQFAFSTFKRVRFENCDLSQVNFLEVDLSGATFTVVRGSLDPIYEVRKSVLVLQRKRLNLLTNRCINCDLREADLTGTKLVGVDLRGCKIDGARVGPRELQGAILDPNQALAFVRGMGIRVAPLEETR